MRRTILLADDSLTIQRLVTNTFADADFEVVSVSNGEAAIRKFEEIHPHVVLADIYMPGKTGYEVCNYVRHHPTVSGTPVILLVGAFDVFEEHRAKEIGATGHITKPFEPQSLISLVESVLPPEEVALDDTIIGLTTETQTVKIEPEVAASPAASPGASPEVQAATPAEETDLLGLESLFPEPPAERAPSSPEVTDSDIDRIADRVIQRISSQVIESIAWELVPDIAEKIVRDEIKRSNES